MESENNLTLEKTHKVIRSNIFVPSPPTKAKAECNNDKGIEKEPELGKEHA
jgi:hypothetical protein